MKKTAQITTEGYILFPKILASLTTFNEKGYLHINESALVESKPLENLLGKNLKEMLTSTRWVNSYIDNSSTSLRGHGIDSEYSQIHSQCLHKQPFDITYSESDCEQIFSLAHQSVIYKTVHENTKNNKQAAVIGSISTLPSYLIMADSTKSYRGEIRQNPDYRSNRHLFASGFYLTNRFAEEMPPPFNEPFDVKSRVLTSYHETTKEAFYVDGSDTKQAGNPSNIKLSVTDRIVLRKSKINDDFSITIYFKDMCVNWLSKDNILTIAHDSESSYTVNYNSETLNFDYHFINGNPIKSTSCLKSLTSVGFLFYNMRLIKNHLLNRFLGSVSADVFAVRQNPVMMTLLKSGVSEEFLRSLYADYSNYSHVQDFKGSEAENLLRQAVIGHIHDGNTHLAIKCALFGFEFPKSIQSILLSQHQVTVEQYTLIAQSLEKNCVDNVRTVLSKASYLYNIDALVLLNVGFSAKKIINYFAKTFKSGNALIRDFDDLIFMLKELRATESYHSLTYQKPDDIKNIEEFHDYISNLYTIHRRNKLESYKARHVSKFSSFTLPTGLIIRPVNSTYELIEIATQLKNCVSSYMDRHNNNELEIIVIVKPDGSYLSCIEVSPSESKNLLNTRDSQMAGGINHDYENQVKQARLIYNKPLKKLFEAPEPVITFPELINYFVQNKIDYHCHDLYN